MDYLVQSPGEYRYPGYDKPIYFSKEFLASLAKEAKYSIEDEHGGAEIAKALEAYWKDGGLWIRTDRKLDAKGRGFSTTIKDYALNDVGGRYEIVKGELAKMALTKDPKDISTFLYNSNNPNHDNDDNNGGDNLTDEIRALEQKVGALKADLNTKIDRIQTLEAQVQTLTTDKSDLQTKLDDKTTKLNEINTKARQNAEVLAKELAGDDDDLFNIYKEMSVEQLKTMQIKSVEDLAKELAGEDEELLKIYQALPQDKLMIIKERGPSADTGFNGVGDAGADDQNNGQDDDNDDDLESHEDWEKRKGIWS